MKYRVSEERADSELKGERNGKSLTLSHPHA